MTQLLSKCGRSVEVKEKETDNYGREDLPGDLQTKRLKLGP